jgi:ribonuclease-3
VYRSIKKFYNYYLSQDKAFARRMKELLGFVPANLHLFKLAFLHKSTTNDKHVQSQNNERLEYLGDAVLGTIVAEYLFKKYPASDEGFLTKMRSKIVKRKSLNKIAEKMGLDFYLSEYNNNRLSRSMMGNALEALMGAIYLEAGYTGTRRYIVNKMLRNYLDVHELETYDDNYKSQLLEWCQKHNKIVTYRVIAKYKHDKRDRFKVAVMVDDEKMAVADDFNKKSAEQMASGRALLALGIIEEEDDEEANDD